MKRSSYSLIKKVPLQIAISGTLKKGIGYSFFPKKRAKKQSSISKVTIYSKDLASNIIIKKTYLKLKEINEEADETEGGQAKDIFNNAYILKKELLEKHGKILTKDSFDSILAQIDELIKKIEKTNTFKTK